MMPKNNQLINSMSKNVAFLTISFLFSIIWLLNIPIAHTLWRHSFDDGTYSHSYLIPLIILYLYHNLGRIGLLQFSLKLDITKLLLLIFSCLFLFLTATAQLSTGYWLAILLVSLASINLLFRFNWYILFPAALLIFIFPIWGALVPLLQDIAIKAVTFIMGFTAIPIYVEKEFITIPAGVFEIAGGCSGLRYLIVSLAISSLFIFLYIKNIKRACLFLTVAIVGALITNWIRITALIMIGDYTDMQSSLMTDHNAFGWYLYLPFMLLLFIWGNKIANIDLLNTKANPQASSYNASPKISILSALLVCLLFSSTTIKSATNSTTNSTIKAESITANFNMKITPNIHFYTRRLQHENTDKNLDITYYFDGSELDGKPSYYENNLISKGWKVINRENNKQWAIYQVSNGYVHGLIRVNYEIDGQVFAQLKAFKIARLKMAWKNIHNTKLHWQFTLCKTDKCVGEF
tara:strand:- start:1164 stop:2552 length:1389 start_codon:yes stop_codon:yes gene_type:complete